MWQKLIKNDAFVTLWNSTYGARPRWLCGKWF